MVLHGPGLLSISSPEVSENIPPTRSFPQSLQYGVLKISCHGIYLFYNELIKKRKAQKPTLALSKHAYNSLYNPCRFSLFSASMTSHHKLEQA